jgi:hypothetical protein
MFNSRTILIADGSTYAALDLSAAVEESEGCVAGPVDTLSEAMTILDSGGVGGAIIDCELPDAAVLIMRLAESNVPMVVQTSIPLPLALEALDGRLSVLMRPIDARTVIDTLVGEIGKAGLRPAHGSGPALHSPLPE